MDLNNCVIAHCGVYVQKYGVDQFFFVKIYGVVNITLLKNKIHEHLDLVRLPHLTFSDY